MDLLHSRWVRFGALGLALLLVAGFVVGMLVRDRGSDATRAVRSSVASGAALGYAEETAGRDVYQVTKGHAAIIAGDAGGGNLDGTTVSGAALPPLGDRIVRTADLSLSVKDGSFDEMWRKAFQIAPALGGFVLSATRGSGGGVPLEDAKDRPLSGDITIRVPTDKYEEALRRLRGLGEVTGEGESSQDVTQEYIDLEGRLRNLKSHQSVLLRLMGQAKTIQDTIIVQEQLSSVQGQIEEITGRLRYLKSQTDLSTISLHLAEPGALAGNGDVGPSLSKAWDTAIEGLERIASAVMIGALWLAPFALLAAIAFGWRRRRPAPQQ